jgi:hypothetical protein
VIGYSYIAVHVVKNNFHNIIIHINPKYIVDIIESVEKIWVCGEKPKKF